MCNEDWPHPYDTCDCEECIVERQESDATPVEETEDLGGNEC